jgi:hypothetical protein
MYYNKNVIIKKMTLVNIFTGKPVITSYNMTKYVILIIEIYNKSLFLQCTIPENEKSPLVQFHFLSFHQKAYPKSERASS